MNEIFILFPIHLYQDITYIKNYKIFLVEEKLYFDRSLKKYGSLKFNILKPIYHRATMKSYYDYLLSKNVNCTYIELNNNWIEIVKNYNHYNKIITFYDPIDKILKNKINKYFDKYNIIDTPNFLLTINDMENYDGLLRHSSFYIWMRKKINILIDENGKAIGGKMTYNVENKKPYSDHITFLNEKDYSNNKYIKEAFDYVRYNINHDHIYSFDVANLNNIDELSNTDLKIKFPINHKESKKRLKKFILYHLNNFSKYQNVMVKEQDNSFVFHSGISPMLNIGLITPYVVINEILKYYNKLTPKQRISQLKNIEGYIRQIVGWREFCRYIYQYHSDKYIDKNYFDNNNTLNNKWYNGTLGIYPVDNCIQKAFKFGYLHHSERLMIIANYMMLTNIHPKEMYKWFMEFSLDSYDWILEYNVFCLGSYSDGGKLTTKPYISSSNYIYKMSNYIKFNNHVDSSWTNIWDKKFWKFIKKNKKKISKIPRLSIFIKYMSKHLGN